MGLRHNRWALLIVAIIPAVLLVGALLLLLLGSESPRAPILDGTLLSYEFRIEVSGGEAGTPDEPAGSIRGWYEAPYKTRWEIGPLNAEEGETAIIVVTRSDFWFYDPETGSYAHETNGSEGAFDGRPFPLVTTLLIGSILPESYTTDEALALLPREKFLGRDVVMLEKGPQGPAPQGLDRYVTIWVDVESRLVLRAITDTAGGTYDARVVELSLNEDVDDDVFVFEPPEGASQEPTPEPRSELLPEFTSPPSKFLHPEYVPAGMRVISSRASASDRGDTLEEEYYSDRGEMTLLQEKPPQSDLLLLGTPVAIGPFEGTHSIRGDQIVISWKQGDVKLSLRSATLSLEELLRVARSMESDIRPQ